MTINLKNDCRTYNILNSSVVKGVYCSLVLAIPEQLERRLDKFCHLGLALIGRSEQASYAHGRSHSTPRMLRRRQRPNGASNGGEIFINAELLISAYTRRTSVSVLCAEERSTSAIAPSSIY